MSETDDSSKPQPNDGLLPTRAGDGTSGYVSQRIRIDRSHVEHFDTDRKQQGLHMVGFHIVGVCPVCNHGTSAVCATQYLAQDVSPDGAQAGRPAVPAGRQPDPFRPIPRLLALGQPIARRKPTTATTLIHHEQSQLTVVQCACIANHVPPSKGMFGCGAEWLLHVTFDVADADRPVRLEPPTDEDSVYCWPVADAAAAAVPAALTTAQATATKWQQALPAFLTLLGVSALLTGRSTISALSRTYQVDFGLLSAVAIIGNLVMLAQSDLASFGLLSVNRALTPGELRDADLQPLRLAADSVRTLKISVRATAVSVVAAILAAAILLFAPTRVADAPPALSTVTFTRDGVATTTACGVVTFPPPTAASEAARRGALTFKPDTAGATAITIPLSSISAVRACRPSRP